MAEPKRVPERNREIGPETRSAGEVVRVYGTPTPPNKEKWFGGDLVV